MSSTLKNSASGGDVVTRVSTKQKSLLGYVLPGLVEYKTNLENLDSVATKRIGIQISYKSGRQLAISTPIEVAAFTTDTCHKLSTTAKINNPEKGLIVAGKDTAAVQAETTLNGELVLQVTGEPGTTVYIACAQTFGGIPLDCRNLLRVSFD